MIAIFFVHYIAMMNYGYFLPLVPIPFYPPSLLNPMDPQMAAMYYPPAMPVCQVQPYSANFCMFPAPTATPYSEELNSPPIPDSIPDSNQPSTPDLTPAQLPNDEMGAFENVTVSSSPASPQVTNDIQQSVIVDNDTVSE